MFTNQLSVPPIQITAMANVANSYALLLAAGQDAGAGHAKKKSKNKSKSKDVDQAPSHPAAPEASVKAPANTAVDVTEATAILERAARVAKTLPEKCRLWREWVSLVRA